MNFKEVFNFLRVFNNLPKGDNSLVPPSLVNFKWDQEKIKKIEEVISSLEYEKDESNIQYYRDKLKTMDLEGLTDELYFLFYNHAERIGEYAIERIHLCFQEIKGRTI